MHVEDLKTWFRKRGYPDFLIKEQVEKALRLTSRNENNSKEVNGVPLVVMHRTVMSLEPYCLAIRYQSSKTKWYKARHNGSEEITDIIFPRIIRNRNIARPRGALDE